MVVTQEKIGPTPIITLVEREDLLESGVLAERLDLLRIRAGLSWLGFCRELGIDYHVMWKYRKGERAPAAAIMFRLMELANAIPQGVEILIGKGEPTGAELKKLRRDAIKAQEDKCENSEPQPSGPLDYAWRSGRRRR